MAVAALSAGVALAGSPAHASTGTLSASDAALLASDAPKTVVVDVATGQVISVRAGLPMTTQISHRTYCAVNDVCYAATGVPYADHGFYGTPGTYSGNWSNRGGGHAGAYTASFCYVGGCSVRISPRTAVGFNPPVVTGTSVIIY